MEDLTKYKYKEEILPLSEQIKWNEDKWEWKASKSGQAGASIERQKQLFISDLNSRQSWAER